MPVSGDGSGNNAVWFLPPLVFRGPSSITSPLAATPTTIAPLLYRVGDTFVGETFRRPQPVAGTGRGSTYVDSAGLVQRAVINEIDWSQDFTNAVWLTDRGTSNLGTVTKLATGIADPNGLSTAARISMVYAGVGSYAAFYNNTRVTAGDNVVSAYVRWVSGATTLRLGLFDGTNRLFSSDITIGPDWTRISSVITALATNNGGNFLIATNVNGDLVVFELAWFQAQQGSTLTRYIPTDSTAGGDKRDAHYVNGVGPYLLREGPRTNILTWCRDLTTGGWAPTTMSRFKDQTGVDGVANSATRIRANGANSTILHANTLASSQRIGSTFVKRVVGTGTIRFTIDGGTTWTVITVTGSWGRVSAPAQTLTNPSTGFQIATSGDEIAVDYVQNEDCGTTSGQAHISSPIYTETVAVTRAGEEYSIPFPWAPQEQTMYADILDFAAINHPVSDPVVLKIGGDGNVVAPETHLYANGGSWRDSYFDDTLTERQAAVTGSADGDRVELRAVLGPDGAVTLGVSINGAAESVNGPSAALALESAWSAGLLRVGSSGSGSEHIFAAYKNFAVVPGTKTMGDMRALWGAASYTLTAAAGVFSVAGQVAALAASRNLPVSVAAFLLTGNAAGLQASRALPTSVGVFNLVGITTGFQVARKLPVSAGAFVLTGNATGLRASRNLSVSAGSFVVNGVAVGLSRTRILIAAAGAFVLGVPNAALRVSRNLPASVGAFALSGIAVGLKASRVLAPVSAAFILNGTATGLRLTRRIGATVGVFTVTRIAAVLKVSRRLPITVGAFSLSGKAMNFVLSGKKAIGRLWPRGG